MIECISVAFYSIVQKIFVASFNCAVSIRASGWFIGSVSFSFSSLLVCGLGVYSLWFLEGAGVVSKV